LVASLFVILGVLYWNGRISARNLFMLIGNSSYSLYLLHNPLQSFLVRVFPKSTSQILIFSEFIFIIVIIAAVSHSYYLVFEKKMISIVKNKFETYVA